MNLIKTMAAFTVFSSVSALAAQNTIPVRWDNRSSASPAESSNIVVLDHQQTVEIKQLYEDISREYDLKRAYGMSNVENQTEYVSKMKDFANQVEMRIKNYHVVQNRSRVLEAVKESETLKPALIVATVGAACTGAPVQVKVNNDLEIISKTDFPSQKGEFQFNSNILAGRIDVSATAPLNNVDPTIRDERVRLSVNRAIPQTDMVSALTYGSTTNSLTASLNKPLTPGLNCELGATQALGANLTQSDQTVKLNYQVRF